MNTTASKSSTNKEQAPERFGRRFDPRTLISAALLAALAVVLCFWPENFYSPMNLGNLADQAVDRGLLAIGMTFVIITGGIDLSVGGVLFLVNCLAVGLLARNGLPIVAIIPICLVAGAGFGALNGILIAYGRLQAFVVTLATMTIGFGAAFIYTQGRPIQGEGLSPFLEWMGTTAEHHIPLGFTSMTLRFPPTAAVFLACIVGAYIILSRTTFGRRVYALGSNEQAARLSGVAVNQVKTLVYALSGLMAALAGLAYTCRVNVVGQVSEGANYELDAIAAVVVGGTSLAGGYGSMIGTLIGVVFLGVVNNIIGLTNTDPYVARLIKGLVILIAVLFQKRQTK